MSVNANAHFIDVCIYLLIFSFSPVVRFHWYDVCLELAYMVAQALNYVRWMCNQDVLAKCQSDRPTVLPSMVLKSDKLDRLQQRYCPHHRLGKFCQNKKNKEMIKIQLEMQCDCDAVIPCLTANIEFGWSSRCNSIVVAVI